MLMVTGPDDAVLPKESFAVASALNVPAVVYSFVAVAEELKAEELPSPKLIDHVYGAVPPLTDALNVIVEPTEADLESALRLADNGAAVDPLL
jgi:hypothetical protein